MSKEEYTAGYTTTQSSDDNHKTHPASKELLESILKPIIEKSILPVHRDGYAFYITFLNTDTKYALRSARLSEVHMHCATFETYKSLINFSKKLEELIEKHNKAVCTNCSGKGKSLPSTEFGEITDCIACEGRGIK